MRKEAAARSILITGATGFLGSFLAERYLQNGWLVHGTSRWQHPSQPNECGVLFHPVDLLNGPSVSRLLGELEPDVVVHLAAQSSVRQSWDNPTATYHVNILGQLTLLESCIELSRRPRVLILGSSDEYGAPDPLDNPILETHPLLPFSPYGVTKVAQDLMGYQYFLAHDLDVIRVRPFLQIGPRRSDTFFSGAFARQVAEAELGLNPPVIEVGDVDLIRDMTDVRDVARACELAIERGKSGEVYNIASGEARPVRALLEAMIALSGADLSIRVSEARRRRREPEVLVGEAGKLREATGWRPMISFEASAADTLSWWRDRLASELAHVGAHG